MLISSEGARVDDRSDRLNEPDGATVDPIGCEDVVVWAATRAMLRTTMAMPSRTAAPTAITSPTRRLLPGGGVVVPGQGALPYGDCGSAPKGGGCCQAGQIAVGEPYAGGEASGAARPVSGWTGSSAATSPSTPTTPLSGQVMSQGGRQPE